MNHISFITANYVARQVGYHMEGWGEGQTATEDYFRPIETFSARFGQILDDICRMGFEHMDLWLGHLNPAWATDEHITLAKAALAQRGLQLTSLAGGFGETLEEYERCARMAQALGTHVLGGMTSLVTTHRQGLIEISKKYDVVMAIENHPEKTPAEVLAQVGDTGEGRILTCFDTGNWAMHNADPASAIEALGPSIVYMHLKDAAADRKGSCRFGQGVVPLERCVRLLLDMGYTGGFSIEHEPHHHDPTEDVVASLQMLKGWLG
jgi:L-ribulose-5-phosphate 3-epimerase